MVDSYSYFTEKRNSEKLQNLYKSLYLLEGRQVRIQTQVWLMSTSVPFPLKHLGAKTFEMSMEKQALCMMGWDISLKHRKLWIWFWILESHSSSKISFIYYFFLGFSSLKFFNFYINYLEIWKILKSKSYGYVIENAASWTATSKGSFKVNDGTSSVA
jgi:hypothetical protein